MAKAIQLKRYNGTQWEELYFPYSHNHTWSQITSKPTTIEGFGITDCSIVNGTITIGKNSIVPITSLNGYATQTWVTNQSFATQTWVENKKYALASSVNTIAACFNTNGEAKEAVADADGNVITTTYATKAEIPTTLPASDVYSWAKASTKPSYTWSEIGSKPTWIGASKPTYTANEVGATTEAYVDEQIDYIIDEELPKYATAESVSTMSNTIVNIGKNVTTLQGYFSNGIAKKATADADGSDIKETYLTKEDAVTTYITGSGTNGYIAKFNGNKSITNGVALSSTNTSKFLGENGTWEYPKFIQTRQNKTSGSWYGVQYPMYGFWETNSICKITVDNYSTKVDMAVKDASGNIIADTYEAKTNLKALAYKDALTKTDVTNALGYTPPTTDTNTTYSQATSSALGLVKIGYTASGKNYPVQLNTSGQMYVNVPWENTDTNTTYSAGTGISLSGTTFSNSGVRSITQDSSNGRKLTINTGGTSTTITIPDSDTKYTLPNATSSVLGGVKIGDNISVSSGKISLTKANVTNALGYTPPTTNTTYSSKTAVSGGTDVSLVTTGEKYTWNSKASTSTASQTASGLMSASDKTKLDGIATGATKVTTSTVSGWGYTKNEGTVTSIKVGTTSYTPSSGVVTIPAYPTSLPASDVYSWAKASTKPTYTASEVGAAPSSLSTTVDSLNTNVTSMSNSISELNIAVNNLAASVVVKTTTVVFNTSTQCTSPSQGAVTSKSITLTDSVQAGDRLKVYVNGGSNAPHLQGGIIELEIFNPSSNSVVGAGTIMSSTGAQTVIISAQVSQINATTTKTLNIKIWGLSTNASSSNSQVWVQKVERIR